MTVRLPELVVAPHDPRPTIVFRLDQMAEGVAVMARHMDDPIEQTLLEIAYHEGTGVLEVRTRDIHTPKLAEVLNIPLGKCARTRFVDLSLGREE